ncbi:hypothetical protein ES705_27273 [subsurface metagenome]
MNKIIPVHHSLADWDFQYGALNRSLSADRFISAPTSLRLKRAAGGAWYDMILCRLPATQCLPQGEVRNWFYGYLTAYMPCCFRNQAALGSANHNNCYYIYLPGESSILYRTVDGFGTTRDTSTFHVDSNTWTHVRVFWYNGTTPGDAPALCVDLYRDVAGEWIKEGSTLYDTDNSWKDEPVNRAGFYARIASDHPQYWDDTEIWGPV